jgi:basic amino acid/polyamine antiporter, APA family
VPEPGTSRAESRQLVRDLGASHAAAIVVGTIIGSGIFLVPAEMVQAVGSSALVYLAWIVGGLLSFFGALTYAELGSMRPEAGGEYAYLRDGYGPLAGFLYAWTWFLIAKPASIASITAGMVRILGTFSIFDFLPRELIHAPIAVTWGQLLAISTTVIITALNYIGVRKAGDFQLLFTLLKIAMIAAIVIVGFMAASGTWRNFTTSFAGAKGGLAGFMAALVAALWAYDGWNDLNMVAGEVRRPQRNLPIGLISGVAVVAVLYVLTNAAVEYVLPASVVAASPRPTSEATAVSVGAWGAALVSAGMALSMLVTLNGTVMSGGRVPFAAARDGYFFSALAKVHPHFRTPSTSLVVQAVLAILLLLLAPTFRQLFSLAIFAEWLGYMFAAGTVFIFRGRGEKAPYSMWGYPLIPALFIAASALLLYYTFSENLRNSAAGLAVILAGVPVFYIFAHKRQQLPQIPTDRNTRSP